jgi:hypothetical protein
MRHGGGGVLGSDNHCGILDGMGRRVVGVAIALGVIGVLGLAYGDRDEMISSYSSVQALGRNINAHGIGCSRVYPTRGRGWADHDAANCEVGSAAVTLHEWKGVFPPTYLREPSRHESWVVGPNWLVAATNRFAAVQVAMVIGGDLMPEEIPRP